jgi:hypothetical protein
MNAARWRLILATGLFVAWLGFLTVLAIRTTHPVVQFWPFEVKKTGPVVLSRPQLLLATLVVIADVQADGSGRPQEEAEVVEVLWPSPPPVQPDQQLKVSNLADAEGWRGPGRYLVPLVKEGDGYRVAATPSSPGFDVHRSFIYPDSPDVREQLKQVRQAEGK